MAVRVSQVLAATSYLGRCHVSCKFQHIIIYSYDYYSQQIRAFPTNEPHAQRSPATQIPALPRLPIAVDIYGDIRLRGGLDSYFYLRTVAPHRVTANDDVALQHASRARGLSSFFGKGRRRSLAMVSLGVLSSFTFGLLRPKIFRPFYLFLFSFYYVGFGEEQIGSRRGCGVNGGLKVTILLGCMKGSCQEASRTCSRVRAVCVAIDLIVGQIRWGGGGGEGADESRFLFLSLWKRC